MKFTDAAVFISPGGSGDPKSPKMRRLAEVARSKGLKVEIFDCTGDSNPEIRVENLLISPASHCRYPILAGSSMGGYVSAVAAETLDVLGLFLIGPALYLEPYENLDPRPSVKIVSIVQGQQDEVVPAENIDRFVENVGGRVHRIPGSHSLDEQLPELEILFAQFLDACLEKVAKDERAGG